MKKVFSLILIWLLIISVCMFSGCLNGDNNENSTAVSLVQNERLTGLLDGVIDDNHFIGSVCVYYNGEKIYEGNRGFADKDNKIKNSPELIYRIGSLSKQFAATGICILKDEGKLDFDDYISKYFSDCSYGDRVTVRNLLNMTSGIPDYFADYSLNKTYSKNEINIDVSSNNTSQKNKELIEKWILSQHLIFETGTEFDYSNSNYFLLGRIIEMISGKSYESYISEKIFEPLGMASTSFDFDSLNTKGYLYDSVMTEEQKIKNTNTEWVMYPGVCTAFADIVSSVEDLHKWITALRKGEVVKPETYSSMIENNDFGYGFGFFTSDFVCGHNGALGTYQSEISFLRDKDFSIIALSNTHREGFYNDICSQLNNVIADNKELLPN